MPAAHHAGPAARVDRGAVAGTFPAAGATAYDCRGQTGASRLHSANDDTVLKILARLPLFADLGREDIALVREACKVRDCPSGSVLFAEGDPSGSLYVVLSGVVEIRVEALGTVHEAGPGELFGEIGYLTQRERSAAAVATDASVLLALEYARLDALCEQRPRLGARLMRNIGAVVAEHLLRMNRYHALEHPLPRS